MLEWRNNQPERLTLCWVRFQLKRMTSRHCFLPSVHPAKFPANVMINRTYASLTLLCRWKNVMTVYGPHGDASTVCAHGIIATKHKGKVEVLHRRYHMCLWKSGRNYSTHVTVLSTRTPFIFGWHYYVQ